MKLTLVNWNVEWATPGSRRTTEILRRIDRHSPEVVCLTEAHRGCFPPADTRSARELAPGTGSERS